MTVFVRDSRDDSGDPDTDTDATIDFTITITDADRPRHNNAVIGTARIVTRHLPRPWMMTMVLSPKSPGCAKARRIRILAAVIDGATTNSYIPQDDDEGHIPASNGDLY